MMDLPISDGCHKLGVLFMSDSVTKEMQNSISELANKIFYEAQNNFAMSLALSGYEWENGVIYKRQKRC